MPALSASLPSVNAPTTKKGPLVTAMIHIGSRVRFLSHGEPDPAPLTPGDEGTVDWIGDPNIAPQQIGVAWDSGRSLILLHGIDRFEVLDK